MSFLKRIFGQSDPLASLRKALGQRRWADAVALGHALDRTGLGSEAAEELDRLLDEAGDSLAQLNLTEGEGCLRGGDIGRAAEHFALAAKQVRSEPLSRRIEEARDALKVSENSGSLPSRTAAPGCITPCSESGVHRAAPAECSLDESTRLELVLGTYPPEMAAACLESSESFRKAFLLAHEGREKEAAELFEHIPLNERNNVYHFEFGAVLGRLGELERACRELEKALDCNMGNILALETLIALEIAAGKEIIALKRLKSLLEKGGSPAFCHGGMAAIHARTGDSALALQHGMEAVAAGNSDPQLLLLTAGLLERAERTDEAESVLRRIPGGGGCSGGVSLPLAEFWLRQKKNLDKALETFKGALRQSSNEPRWVLRIAQTYIARGWEKEGMKLLRNALDDPNLEQDLRGEGSALLNALECQINGSP